VRRTRFDRAPCAIARTTDLVGDWWTPVVLREACFGRRRFDEFQSALGLSRGVLAQRLGRLTDEGLLAKQLYQQHPPRYEYRLTDKGRAFFDILAAMWRWGNDWLWEEGQPPLEWVDSETGRVVQPRVVDEQTGEPIDPRRLSVRRRRNQSA
jgi:DNA-binding HxlR family transcriptional regulator